MLSRVRVGMAAVLMSVALTSVGCGVGREHVLVVYTSLDAAVVEAVEDGFEAAHEDVDVRMVALSPEEALERLRAEKGGSQADVWWGAPVEFLSAAGTEDLLATSSPSWASSPMEGAEDRWHVVGVSPFVFAFDVDRTARSRMPRDWGDVLHYRWAGSVLLPDPERHPATALLMSAWIDREAQRTGDVEAGYDWLRRLDGVTAGYPVDPDGVIDGLRAGTGSVGILPLADVVRAGGQGESWLRFKAPEGGSPLVGLGVGLLAGSEARGQGEQFLEYLGGPEAQAAMATAGWLEELQGTTPWPVDYGRAAAEMEGRLRRWRMEVRGASGMARVVP